MHRADAYAVLTRELESWRQKSASDLEAAVGTPPEVEVVKVHGEDIRIEVVVAWIGSVREAVRIDAVAYGPSHWRLERLEEGITVRLSPERITKK